MTDILKGWFCDHAPGRGKIITGSGGGGGGGSGRFYFEVTVTTGSGAEAKALMGVATSTFNLSNPYDLDISPGPNAALDGGVFYAANTVGCPGWSGDPGGAPNALPNQTYNSVTIGMVYDSSLRAFWARQSGGSATWQGSGASPDPTTGSDGYPVSQGGLSGSVFILCGIFWDPFGSSTQASLVLNTGGSSFAMTLPTNCAAWGASDTLNPSDADAHMILSGGNLSLTSNISTNHTCGFVRSIASKS